MISRRNLIRTTGTTALGLALGGCLYNRSPNTKIGKIVVGNYQPRDITIHLLLLCDNQPQIWKSFHLKSRAEATDEQPSGTVLSEISKELTDCNVYAQLNNEDDKASLNLDKLDTACTNLQVYAEKQGEVTIYYSAGCE